MTLQFVTRLSSIVQRLWTSLGVERLWKCCHRELRHPPARVNPAWLPLTHMLSKLSFLPSVTCTCMHTHHIEVCSRATKRPLFLHVDIQKQIKRTRLGQKRQSIHAIKKICKINSTLHTFEFVSVHLVYHGVISKLWRPLGFYRCAGFKKKKKKKILKLKIISWIFKFTVIHRVYPGARSTRLHLRDSVKLHQDLHRSFQFQVCVFHFHWTNVVIWYYWKVLLPPVERRNCLKNSSHKWFACCA